MCVRESEQGRCVCVCVWHPSEPQLAKKAVSTVHGEREREREEQASAAAR